MDGKRFDDLTKSVTDGTPSRRRMLRGFAGGALAAVFSGVSLRESAAAPKAEPAVDQLVCANEPLLCNRSGETATRCGGTRSCSCARLANGDRRCVVNSEGCPRRTQCDTNKDCDSGEVCVNVEGCCGEDTGAKRACVRRCN